MGVKLKLRIRGFVAEGVRVQDVVMQVDGGSLARLFIHEFI